MTNPHIPVTEDELHAYVDNELPAERRGDVEAWLATHPDDAARVRSWRTMAEALHVRYDGIVDEAVPRRLEIERLVRQPRKWFYAAIAATLAAFIVGGGVGWMARGASAAAPSAIQNFTLHALEAHRLYVVEVRHPVEVPGSERAHLQAWLTKRCGWLVRAPELTGAGLKLVGGRLLPGSGGPASFMMYESTSGERFTIYTAKSEAEATQMRFSSEGKESALFWADRGVAYVVVSSIGDRGRLTQIAQSVYDQMEKPGG
ncbi:anti-sigma factor [Bradyrhizobium sp. AUGA SZCCT0240]|jgi:anti-sigma factor RsiW|uniref:anti-sigma factor family protein n=1 Tax=unclassified Bradyrhizobium TaxID=2631580 RepID=UPI001BADDE6E|nr:MULTISPECIES: anti-sigma factor [unclassified Bradyrhizobium]MBR1190862.1 anti-sigma factor [Bradyrhizobium sp. AUGA SZCCT0160]MBR1200684.1 anti-sigma factor [Bradyrhizobium sp. AUGA SZCCT0158]MBR1244831.1 anti-sigma factor [Bradyrhizobium sp. AUGA SZCCT0274]MBR1258581.1 anti-sigma factor [Bradyrhizobium sp. AUGA SZCCT0240]